jgi:hypothetical protein
MALPVADSETTIIAITSHHDQSLPGLTSA